MQAKQVYALLNKKIKGLASGVKSVWVDEETTSLNFLFQDDTIQTITFPEPEDGISIVSAKVDKVTNHLMIEMSDKSVLDAGKMPALKVQISRQPGNGIRIKDDGLYYAATGVALSDEKGNTLVNLDDGLYVPSVSEQKEKLSEEVLDIIKDNIEDEDIDFTDFF